MRQVPPSLTIALSLPRPPPLVFAVVLLQGLCSVMGADGTCWVRMQPVMKCFTRAISIKSGMCKGTFQTSLCAPSSQDVEEALFALGLPFFYANTLAQAARVRTPTRKHMRTRTTLVCTRRRAHMHTLPHI